MRRGIFHLWGLTCSNLSPWARASELIDFVREVKAPTSIAIHDRVYSEAGHGIVDNLMGGFLAQTGQEFKRLKDGADL